MAWLWLNSLETCESNMAITRAIAPGASSSESPPDVRPDFFLVGAPKCGTTAMAHYLGRHPDIFMARKEMNVFGADLRFGPQFYRRDLSAYLSEFTPRQGQRRAGEASVWHLFSSQAAAEIKAFNPDARIIIMLREPSEMLYSLYYQFRFDGNEPLPAFEDALAAQDERRAGRAFGRQTYFPQGLVYRDTVRYTDQVRRYFEAFGRSRVLVILYEEFAAGVEASYRAVLDFLGVDSTRVELDFRVINGNKRVRNPALRAVLSDRFIRATAVNVARKLPQPLFRLLHDFERRLWKLNERPVDRPPLAPDLRAALRREFAPDIERLGALLGRDLALWNQPPRPHGIPTLPALALRPARTPAVACSSG